LFGRNAQERDLWHASLVKCTYELAAKEEEKRLAVERQKTMDLDLARQMKEAAEQKEREDAAREAEEAARAAKKAEEAKAAAEKAKQAQKQSVGEPLKRAKPIARPVDVPMRAKQLKIQKNFDRGEEWAKAVTAMTEAETQ
jgi:hypothetical protein